MCATTASLPANRARSSNKAWVGELAQGRRSAFVLQQQQRHLSRMRGVSTQHRTNLLQNGGQFP